MNKTNKTAKLIYSTQNTYICGRARDKAYGGIFIGIKMFSHKNWDVLEAMLDQSEIDLSQKLFEYERLNAKLLNECEYFIKANIGSIWGLVQTSLFSCAEPSAIIRILLIYIRFGAWEEQRLKRAWDSSELDLILVSEWPLLEAMHACMHAKIDPT